MKSLALLLLLASINAQALEARYFRAWQGFKKTDLTDRAFMNALPSFIQETVDLYDGAGILSNYLVIIPPAFVPRGLNGYIVIANQDDEVAFMNWESKQAMQAASSVAVRADAQRLMNNLMFQPAAKFQSPMPVKFDMGYRGP